MVEALSPRKYDQQLREFVLDKLIWGIQFVNLLVTKWIAFKEVQT